MALVKTVLVFSELFLFEARNTVEESFPLCPTSKLIQQTCQVRSQLQIKLSLQLDQLGSQN